MATSKSFRATLPPIMNDAQLALLQEWTGENCSTGVAFREPDGTVIWLASRERPKTKEAFLRSVRARLKSLGIDTRALKGRWLALTTESVVSAEAGAVVARAPAQASTPRASALNLPIARGKTEPDENVKVVALSGDAGKPNSGARLIVTKEV